MKKFLHAILLFYALSPICAVSDVNPNAVKVSFINNFLKLVQWPDSSLGQNSGQYKVCLAWRDYFENAKALLTQASQQAHKISIQQVTETRHLQGCHLLYISKNDSFGLTWLQKDISNFKSHMLIISDKPEFIDQGGIIGLIEVDGRLAFEVNYKQAQNVELFIPAQILKLAVRVID